MKKAKSEKRISKAWPVKALVANSLEMEQLKSQLARTLADYDNLKRRTEEEKISWTKFSSLSIISRLLPIMDMLEKAQEHLKDSGLAISILEFKKVFIEEGLEEINPKIGSEFDENSQEVIEVIDGKMDNMISEVLVTGWKFKDGNVVRHAKVIVSKQLS
ncbi:MAG: Protein GrpE [Microgenomates group bacterium GW2011_GWC1_39_7b]|uniref:Protein GrpE n=3 Tax=Candidatus Woeseibacteriota TaxID=1752722 RepID=A0A0G0P205_9BACT|nr:MAG: Protein GrpE [Candidatus Woesebacteria bacterium GW2011_GWB1_39_10]KKR26841.1 MAG: Protein GrpE [Microgenomates group bacterium GW2011_GWC1_39_7b]KKR73180.1 MAG: Protein GrpE [Candidatus Woesebacteria bacterium GW2011_GWA2_40_7]KKS91069.1 MAG: Protein GrpE [Candidatus Woesebacteria bacterium GW2011_GWA1_43_12]